ncbi:MAG: 50S ribosomal protein L22 [Alphaproteobacteria bacterium]|jgi:large subunit ribosomal protein L22|nr:50S ribosomal protein L22 [Alphaproteobacteria bacterium]
MAEAKSLNSTSATLTNIKTSVQKLNLVAGLIRRQPVGTALNTLAFTQKRNAEPARKLLMSAIANAENNNGLDVDRLYVDEVLVGKSITLKRFHCRGRGKGARVLKHYSQMTIIVREAEQEDASTADKE